VVGASEREYMEERLVATTSQGMQEAKVGMTSWLSSRISEEESLISDINENIEIARKSKWRLAPFKSSLSRAERKLMWYQKVKEAIDQGFTLVPNFPCSVIAIRTCADGPKAKSTDCENWTDNVKDEVCEQLPMGQGKYVSPEQRINNSSYQIEQNGKVVKHYIQEAMELNDPSFPFIIAKPALLNATQEAMALRLFDEIAVFPGQKENMRTPLCWEG